MTSRRQPSRPGPVEKAQLIREALDRDDITPAELAAITGRPLGWAERTLTREQRPAAVAERRARKEREAKREATIAEAVEAGLRNVVRGPATVGRRERPTR